MAALPALALHFLLLGTQPLPLLGQASVPCRVTRIVDGDTLYCDDTLKVRLIGIDAPERQQGRPGRESSAALRRLVPLGTRVRLEEDLVPKDRWGRTLAYAWVGSTLVNEAMVQGGWAVLFTIPPNVKYANRLRRAQSDARHAGAGLWREDGFACPPAAWRHGEC